MKPIVRGSDGPAQQRRNLGAEIIAWAIADYRTQDYCSGAASFLFPQSPDEQRHFDLVVAMANTVNPKWLRNSLDRMRPSWDRERANWR